MVNWSTKLSGQIWWILIHKTLNKKRNEHVGQTWPIWTLWHLCHIVADSVVKTCKKGYSCLFFSVCMPVHMISLELSKEWNLVYIAADIQLSMMESWYRNLFLRKQLFVKGIHHHEEQSGALMFSSVLIWTSSNLRCHDAHVSSL